LQIAGYWSLGKSTRHQLANKNFIFQQPATSNQQPATELPVATAVGIVLFKQVHSSRSARERSLLAPDHRGYNP
jgi:hypothetical protein